MKKLIAILTMLTMVLSLAACTKSEKDMVYAVEAGRSGKRLQDHQC